MRTSRVLAAVLTAGLAVSGLAACGNSQADQLAEQLRKAGYTDVSAEADYDEKVDSKTKKKKKTLDDYEAEAKAGGCNVEVEQDKGSKDYVIEVAGGADVNFRNLTATALIAELKKQGITC